MRLIFLRNPMFGAIRRASTGAQKISLKPRVSQIKKPAPTNDSRHVLIKKMLYDEIPGFVKPIVQKATPTIARENPVYVGNDPTLRMQDNVERVWCLYKMQEKQEQMQVIKRTFNSMREAMEKLQMMDKRLFEAALLKKDVELFPRRMKIPTETSSKLGWDYEMNHNRINSG